MLSPSTLHDLASGKRRGLAGALFRAVATTLEVPVRWYVQRKNNRYDRQANSIERVAMPVISVGNLTTGGTGKSPLVRWIASWLLQQGHSVVLLSRGYGSAAQGGAENDEARELAALLPGIPHLQNPSRVDAARMAAVEYPGAVLLLDDAFQHRRLHRDLDIVLLDSLAPFGYEHLIPRGFLREPVEGLSRAQLVILTRANQVDAAAREAIRERARQLAPQAVWGEAVHAPLELRNSEGTTKSLDLLRGCRVAAFSGIGNPESFRRTLLDAGANLIAWREFPDHYAYNPQQLASLERWAAASGAEAILCTQKDLVKIPRKELAAIPLWSLVVGMQFSLGEEEVTTQLVKMLARFSATAQPAESFPAR